MSERKAINKYYPPDWDPEKVPEKKKVSPNAQKVRLMVPFSMKCLQCTEYIPARRKFNARKEITAEKYMGIKIIRFHIKCPRCNNALLFQTDPKLAGFIPVSGVSRNYESLSTQEVIKPMETEDEILERLERQEKEDQEFQNLKNKRKRNPFYQSQPEQSTNMADLEERLLEQQREQEINDHLAFLLAKSARIELAGGREVLSEQARKRVLSAAQNDGPSDELQLLRATARTPPPSVAQVVIPPTVSGVISIKRPRKAPILHSYHDQPNSQEKNNSAQDDANKSQPELKSTEKGSQAHPSGISVLANGTNDVQKPNPTEKGLSALSGYSSDSL